MDAAEVCRTIEARGKQARFIPAVADIVEYVASEAQPGDVILAMSGRDFQGLHKALLEKLQARFTTRPA
jgi:UDP-N-acetylmuramate-alanine ligase